MPAKQFQFHAEARQSILRGATVLADSVRVTLGPKSKCVLIEKKFGRPAVCDGGVTIPKEVELKDPEENLGAHMVREAAEKTGEAVGDGPTTSTLLAHAIVMEGVRNVAAGASAIDLKLGLTRGLKAAVASIRAQPRPDTRKREKAQVAAVAAHSNANVVDMRILKRALEAPTRQIAENSNLDAGVVVDRTCSGSAAFALDAVSGKYVDLMEPCIIDATKVVRVALENAISVAE